ncbi:MAG: hypothetical protein ACTHMP_15435 [Thermomicrobiales bacterium]
MVKWWDRFWGAVWSVGSLAIAYFTGRWFAHNAAPADLGGLRYGLIVFATLFGWLVGAFCLSMVVIGITSGLERIFAKLGHPFVRPPLSATEALAGMRTGAAPPAASDATTSSSTAEASSPVPDEAGADVTTEQVATAGPG